LSTGISAVVWHKFSPSDQKVYYRRLSATGTSLCSQTFDAGTIPAINKTPCVAVANGTSAVYWRDMDTWWNIQLYEGAVNSSCNKGSGVMYPNNNAQHPDVDGLETSGNISVVFDLSGKIYEFLGGQNVCVLSSPSGSASFPRIAYDNTRSFVIWQDNRDGNAEIYMCTFIQDCSSEAGDVRLTTDPASSQRPDIAMSKDGQEKWVVVWQDSRDGNAEIYMTGKEIRGYGWLTGVVSGEGGAPLVEGAKVTVKQGETTIQTVYTGSDGRYITNLLSAGSYDLQVEKNCYTTYTEDAVEIQQGVATVKNVELALAKPVVSTILPDTITVGDSRVDLQIEGSGFQVGDTVYFDPVTVKCNFVSVWNDSNIHVNVDIDSSLSPLLSTVSVRVKNTCGTLSDPYYLPLYFFNDASIPNPRRYAPIFWFAPNEKWLPTSPLFRGQDGNTKWSTAISRNEEYSALTDEEKTNRAVVYYYVYGDRQNGVPFPGENDPECMVYEYWLYFTYDEFPQCGPTSPIFNQHYHDWEKFFVFVDRQNLRVRGVAASAHNDFNAGNSCEYTEAPPASFHPTALVEFGSHATCPDSNANGIFERNIDLNGCAEETAWGIQDLIPTRNPEDKLHPPQVGGGSPTYGLTSLNAIKQVVDPQFTEQRNLWGNSREALCLACNPLVFTPLWIAYRSDINTFIGSPVAGYDSQSSMVSFFKDKCKWLCWTPGEREFITGHAPIEYAWSGKQGEYLSNPRKILPYCNGSVPTNRFFGNLQNVPVTACDFALVVMVTSPSGGSMAVAQSEDEPYPVAYARPGSDGTVTFSNLKEGVYAFYVKPEEAAPYEQILNASPTDTLLGVNGNIYLVPDTSYFTLKIEAKTNYGVSLPMAQVRVIAEPNSLVLPTLADSAGLVYASLDTSGTYKVTIKYYEYEDSASGIRGSFGDTVSVSFEAIGIHDGNAPRMPSHTMLYQNYPNPFNPVTLIKFDISRHSHVHLKVLDITGRVVATVFDGECESGTRQVSWNGRDSAGRELASGVYFLRLEAGGFVATRKMVLLK